MSRAQSQKSGLAWLGLAWLWPKPGLLTYMYNLALFDLECDLNIFNYLPYSVFTLFYLFMSGGGVKS